MCIVVVQEIIVRKKDKQQLLDGQQMSMIENALYYTNPTVATKVRCDHIM